MEVALSKVSNTTLQLPSGTDIENNMPIKLQLRTFIAGLLFCCVIAGVGWHGLWKLDKQERSLKAQLNKAMERCGEKHPDSLKHNNPGEEYLNRLYGPPADSDNPCWQDEEILNIQRKWSATYKEKDNSEILIVVGLSVFMLLSVPFIFLTVIPFMWYYVLRRIRELSAALIGR